MTKQRSAQRLADAGADDRADFEIDAQVGAIKEQSGLRRLRDDLLLRSRCDLIEALATDGLDGKAVIIWSGGKVCCKITNRNCVSEANDHSTILGALAAATSGATETGL